MSAIILILLVIGTILCVFEMFAPGFGVFGISGLISLIISSIIACFYYEVSFGVLFLIEFVVIAIVALITIYVIKKTNLAHRIILKDHLKEDTIDIDSDKLLNKIGISKTQLKPVGTVIIDNNTYEVLSSDGFININEKIIVIKVVKNKIFVGKYKEEEL